MDESAGFLKIFNQNPNKPNNIIFIDVYVLEWESHKINIDSLFENIAFFEVRLQNTAMWYKHHRDTSHTQKLNDLQ